jgi:hypothetical protein
MLPDFGSQCSGIARAWERVRNGALDSTASHVWKAERLPGRVWLSVAAHSSSRLTDSDSQPSDGHPAGTAIPMRLHGIRQKRNGTLATGFASTRNKARRKRWWNLRHGGEFPRGVPLRVTLQLNGPSGGFFSIIIGSSKAYQRSSRIAGRSRPVSAWRERLSAWRKPQQMSP